jgi:hypothetical protein
LFLLKAYSFAYSCPAQKDFVNLGAFAMHLGQLLGSGLGSIHLVTGADRVPSARKQIPKALLAFSDRAHLAQREVEAMHAAGADGAQRCRKPATTCPLAPA